MEVELAVLCLDMASSARPDLESGTALVCGDCNQDPDTSTPATNILSACVYFHDVTDLMVLGKPSSQVFPYNIKRQEADV